VKRRAKEGNGVGEIESGWCQLRVAEGTGSRANDAL
jgi:hypothetical protein